MISKRNDGSLSQMSARDQYDFAQVLSKIDAREKEQRSLKVRYRVACGICALALLGAGVSLTMNLHKPQDVQSHICSVSSRTGSSSIVTLADGTKVHLKADSRLSYASDYSPNNRNVKLTGNAYFDVVTDPEHPLTVELDNCSVRVTGTKFEVQAPDNIDQIKTTLIQGHIDFISDKQTLKLDPGEVIHFGKSSGNVRISRIDPESYLALMEGKVEYYNVTISELAACLERMYGNRIILDDALKQNKVALSMRLVNGESFDEVITALKIMLPMSIRYQEDTVWLSSHE